MSGGSADLRQPWDRELLASKSFVVVPSLGALVPGWLLVVPRRPIVSLRDLNSEEREEFGDLLIKVKDALGVFSGDVFAFEHGSDHRGSVMGCGVDHAHLHLVPLQFDLVDSAMSHFDADVSWTIKPEFLLTDLPSSGEYMSVWRVNTRQGAVATVARPISQWMRRVIAGKLGMQADWDYRASPQLRNIEQTVQTILPWTSSTR